MSHVSKPHKPAQEDSPEFLWGAAAIGAAIDRTARQAYHMLMHGRIKSARKVGATFMANAAQLRREFGAE